MISFLYEVGMVLLGGVFIWAGTEHFLNFKAMAGQLAEQHFPAPGFLLAAGSVVEIVAGLCLASGIARPYAAAALVAFTIAASVMALDFWRHSGPERQAMRSAFMINIAVVGGLITAATADLR
ncbi:DoxX family protein [Aquamicrobium sp. LC103]|uniref:DoxX family protein n=1 Tax=Aquamicrobium sp. LC103 TaxID=1120658 RepID=UPI00063ECECD|nr:DoxX family protein [Aquamicrobium sp. LC103]TKT76256.1 DoxX family protein [Aquamicrobium sp. LC103]